MKRWRLSDEELPTWLHTTLTMLIVSPFALMLAVPGAGAIHDAVLEPMMGTDFGVWMVGNQTLHGPLALQAGWSLVALGLSFIGMGAWFCRWSENNTALRAALLALWAIAAALYL